MRRLLRAAAIALGCLGLAACPFPIPAGNYGRDNIGDTVPASISTGKTTREEVLLALGEPDGESGQQQHFTYYRVEGHGGMGFLLVTVGGGGAATSEKKSYTRLLIDFDANGTVSAAHVQQDSCAEGSVYFGREVSSEPCVRVDPHGPLEQNAALVQEEHPQLFGNISWFAGAGSRQGLFRAMAEPMPVLGTVVVTDTRVMFFGPGADSESTPLFRREYSDIAASRLDTSLLGDRLVIVGTDAKSDAFELAGFTSVAGVANAIKERLDRARR